MRSNWLIVACDFGTTTFRTLVSGVSETGAVQVLGCGEVPAVGFEDGDFVDMREGARCIARTIRSVEAAAEVDISAFYHNISGSHLRSVEARGQIQIGPGPRAITTEDLDAVLAKARSLIIPFDHWILAVNPVEYAVDRVRGIVDPRGRLGSQLEVKAHLITGSRSVVRNVEHAITMAGYDAAGSAVDVLATCTSLLSRREKEQGVLLIDIGGRATQWALFENDCIAGIGTIPWGGCNLTTDLAHGLRIDWEQAERIKKRRGIVLRSLVPETDLEVLFEEESPEETPGLVAAILEPRMEEILSLVKMDLGDAGKLHGLGAGIVLTGGGSRCDGTTSLCEEVFGLPVRRRNLPPELDGAELLEDGQWATALGLSIWAASMPQPSATSRAAPAETSRLWRRVRGWLDKPVSSRLRASLKN